MNKRKLYNDGRLTAIKVDVEGAELKALQGAIPLLKRLYEESQHRVGFLPDITCEIGPVKRWREQGQTANDAIELLEMFKTMNYRLFLLHDPWPNFDETPMILKKFLRKSYVKKYFVKDGDIGNVMEIQNGAEKNLVNDLFRDRFDFNIWLSQRDLNNILISK